MLPLHSQYPSRNLVLFGFRTMLVIGHNNNRKKTLTLGMSYKIICIYPKSTSFMLNCWQVDDLPLHMIVLCKYKYMKGISNMSLHIPFNYAHRFFSAWQLFEMHYLLYIPYVVNIFLCQIPDSLMYYPIKLL